MTPAPVAPIEAVLHALGMGERVVVIEEDSEEATGCVLVAADQVSEADINFMAAHARGLVCLAITEDKRKQLKLPWMASGNREREAYTVSIEAAEGVSTGISAADRALTTRVAAARHCRVEDLVQPGHVFPVVAQPDGVLRRAGFAEACSDLPRLAGREAAGAYAMLLDDAGELLRGQNLMAFARQHGLRVAAISDLIHHRLLVESTLRRTSSTELLTPHGRFALHAYYDAPLDAVHLALVMGEIDPAQPVLARVQAVEVLRDVILADAGHPADAAAAPTPNWNLSRSLARIGAEGRGVVVLLAEREPSAHVLSQLARLETGAPSAPPSFAQRALGVGAQILRDVGARRLRLLSQPVAYRNIAGFDLEVAEFLPPDGTRLPAAPTE